MVKHYCTGLFLVLLLPFFLLACVKEGQSLAQRQGIYEKGLGENFKREYFSVTTPLLLGFIKKHSALTPEGNPLVVYIEGDFKEIMEPENNGPSLPPNLNPIYQASPLPTALIMASKDARPNVLYLVRPGQLEHGLLPRRLYAGQARYSPAVVKYLNSAIDIIKQRYSFKCFILVGYSGGGALATIIAEKRTDVQSLVTVAGVLDTKWWTDKIGASPLSSSLNPAEGAQALVAMPQTHFYAEHDDIVPADMPAHFESLAPFKNFRKIPINGPHSGPWKNNWQHMLEQLTSEMSPLL